MTLDLAEFALAAGFELKDASAWNVIFDACRPVFCDHLSFERIERREWRAFGQFARHFTLPMLIASRCGLPVHAQFRMYRDGITPQLARALCGWGMWFSRAAPLVLAARASEASVSTLRGGGATEARRGGWHANLLRYCRSSLMPAHSGRGRPPTAGAVEWSDYVRDRDHYAADAVTAKRGLVRAWIERFSPAWVLDLGANTGEFSKLAAQCGARVIAVDGDHECIDRLYADARADPKLTRSVFPTVAQIDDLCAGRGWAGREFPGLAQRLSGHCDVVMMLGLVHHLVLACAIPVPEVAAFAAQLTGRALILETIGEGDPMFAKLAAHYGRADAARVCGQASQLQAFTRHFDVVESVPLPGTQRVLRLLVKKSA